MKFSFSLEETPPSLNRFAGGGSRGAYLGTKKQWQQHLGLALMAAGVPRGLSKVKATAKITFPVHRRRDEGNLRFMLEKSLGDILVEGGWLEDDQDVAFEFGRVILVTEKGMSRTVIELEVEEGARVPSANGTPPNSQLESEDQRGATDAKDATKRTWKRGVKG